MLEVGVVLTHVGRFAEGGGAAFIASTPSKKPPLRHRLREEPDALFGLVGPVVG